MQSQNKILDDMAKVASSAMGVAAGLRGEFEARFREQMERLLTQMDLVPREEFDAMKAVAVAAREGQETLAEQVAALEKRLEAVEAAQKAEAQKAEAQKAAKKASPKAAETPKHGTPKHGETPQGDG